jgi:ketosteroid isomerase-like protein
MSMQRSKLSAWINWASGASGYGLISLFCCALCQCTQHYDHSEAERYIIESERQWAESVASGDTTAIQRILADDFVGVDPKGRQYDKSVMISETGNAPKYFASNQLNNVKVVFYGDTAVAQGDESWQRHSGER